MTPKTFLYGIASLAAVAALATSCQDDDCGLAAGNSETITFDVLHAWAPDESRSDAPRASATAQHLGCDTLVSDDKQDTLYLHRSVSDLAAESAAMSRADIATAANLEKFKVSCVKNKDGGVTEYYFKDLVVSKQGSGNFSNSENQYCWLGTGKEKYDFYAYAPSTFSATHPATAGTPNFIYNSGAGHNCDLMVAKKTGMTDKPASDAEAVVGLSFEHLLSGIRFKVDAGCDEIQISKIEIKGLNMSGTCSYDGGTDKWTWSNLLPSSTKSLVRNFETSYNTTPGTESDIDAKDGEGKPTEATFFVVPQTAPTGASIELTYVNEYAETKTLSASIAGAVLGQGELHTYALKVKDESIEFTVVQEGLHLKFNITKGKKYASSLTPSIILKTDDTKQNLIDNTVGFYGSGTTPASNKLSGPDAQGYYYYDGSFFMSKAIDRYNALQPTDASGDYSKYCWDSNKDIDQNKAVKTQTYTVTLTNSSGQTFSADVDFHFDYMQYTYATTAAHNWVHNLLRDTRAERGNFTMEDYTNKKWRNSSNVFYSDELLGAGQKMEGLSAGTYTIRVYISGKDVETVGVSTPKSITDAERNDQFCLSTIDTPVPKASSGKVNFAWGWNMTSVSDQLMAKQGDGLEDLSYCFYFCINLTSLDLKSFNTSKVKYMQSMFEQCNKLESLDNLNFDTANVQNMNAMFVNCKISSLNVANWDTKNVEDMARMFNGCTKLQKLDLSSFVPKNVTTMKEMFKGCTELEEIIMDNFDASKVETIYYMFKDCKKLEKITIKTQFKTTNKVTDMWGVFWDCEALTGIDLSKFDTSEVKTMSNMFDGCKSLTSLDVSNFDTKKVDKMSCMFKKCKGLTSLNLSNFITTIATGMDNMFDGCEALTSLTLSNNFDTQLVEDMKFMFQDCKALTSIDLSSFDIARVRYMQYMFSNCSSLTSLNLSSFTHTEYLWNMEGMFNNCSSLTSLDLKSFLTTKNVTNMSKLFCDCTNLTSLNLKNFDKTKVTSYTDMFTNLNNSCEINCTTAFKDWVISYPTVPSGVTFTTWDTP